MTGQQTATDQFVTERPQFRRAHRGAETFGKPGDELIFLFGADLHWTPDIRAVDDMGNGSLTRERHDLGAADLRLILTMRQPA